MFDSIEATTAELAHRSYIAGEGLATSLFLALKPSPGLKPGATRFHPCGVER